MNPQIKHRGYTDPYAWEEQPLSPEVKATLLRHAKARNLYLRPTDQAEQNLAEYEEALLFAKHCVWLVLAFLALCAMAWGFFFYKIGPAILRLLVKAGL